MTLHATISQTIHFTEEEVNILERAEAVIDNLTDLMANNDVDEFYIENYGSISRGELDEAVALLRVMAADTLTANSSMVEDGV